MSTLSNLSHLHATVLTLDRPLHRFGHIICSSTHLKSLDLTLHAQDSHVQRISAPPPILQNTTLTSAPSRTLQSLHLNDFQYTADCALQTVALLSQWPNLRTLHLTLRLNDGSAHLLRALSASGPSLPPLCALTINLKYYWDCESAYTFSLVALLRALPTALRQLHLTVPDPYDSGLLDAVGTYHGPSVESLELLGRAPRNTPLMGQTRLNALLAQCGHLTHLGLTCDLNLRYCAGDGGASGGLRSVSSLYLRTGGSSPR